MKRSRFTDSQILAILKPADAGAPVPELCREHGMSKRHLLQVASQVRGHGCSLMARLKELEEKNGG